MLRLAGMVAASCALALPAMADVPPDLLAAAQRLPAATQFDPVQRAAACVFAEGVRHLDPLPSAQPWTRPEAIVVLHGLPAMPEGSRAALMRPTREMLARVAVRDLVASGAGRLLNFDLTTLSPESPAAAYLAILSPAGTDAPATCTLRTRR